ncbi:MAG: biopolymer transporter ExbD [Candidatus Brocadiae bacterium]|nr:biopolymer transporter ExbD [Candidatus Brocadiia bacterium]
MSEQEKNTLWKLKKKDTGKIYEKIPFSSLKAWVLEARVFPEDFVMNPLSNNWVKAEEIQELNELFFPEGRGGDLLTVKGMAFPWKSQEIEPAEIDFTPMIDMTFLLLIFFISTATFTMHEIKNIQVPKAAVTQKFKEEKLAVTIDKNKRICLGKNEIQLSSLKKALMDEVNKTREQDIILAADHSLDYGFIVSVLDEINGAGIKNVKLKIEKLDKK